MVIDFYLNPQLSLVGWTVIEKDKFHLHAYLCDLNTRAIDLSRIKIYITSTCNSPLLMHKGLIRGAIDVT